MTGPADDQPPWPGPQLAGELAAAWSSWLQSSAAAMSAPSRSGQDPISRLTALLAGTAASVSAPLRELVDQQRELAEAMERWAQLQHELAEQVQTWAEHQRRLASTLEAMAAPLAAWAPRTDPDDNK